MDEFWTLTPRIVQIVLNSEMDRRNQEAKFQAELAAYVPWRFAHFSRYKTLPKKPDNLMGDQTKKALGSGQDWRAQKQVFEMINAMYGGFDNRRASK